MHLVENDYFLLSFDPEKACWSLERSDGDRVIKDVRMSVSYRRGRERIHVQLDHLVIEHNLQDCPSPHGILKQLRLVREVDDTGLKLILDFAIPTEHPLLLWRLQVENHGSNSIRIERLTLLDIENLRQTYLMPSGKASDSLAFYSNGWGSWDNSGVYNAQDRFQGTRLGPFASPMRVNAGTPNPWKRGRFASDMFGVLGDRRSRNALLVGFISQEEHFGSLDLRLDGSQPALRLWANGDGARLDPGRNVHTDWACLHLLNVDEQDPLSPYLDAVTRQNAIPSDWLTAQSPAGWCSWYQFFQELTAEDVRRNLFTATDLYKTIPLQIFQIDDGFETRVGDWFSFSQDFPDGVASLASEIRQMGFTPGLWLAPFILQRNSRLAREHPDWLLRGRLNQPVNAGFIWDTITTALDLTHPEAMDYACQVVNSAVSEWGFPYLKLDFLYAAALLGRRRDPTQTRAQVLRSGLKKLRQTAGEETFILGCGCPLGSALGLVQAMRIGADVDVRWHPTWKGIQFFFEHEPGLPSTRNAIQNAITRASLHRRWWLNDPDCLLLRPTTELTLVEVQSLATVIGMSDGLMFLSDDLPEVPAERLRVAQAFLPPIGISPRVMDWFDSRMPQRLRTDLHNASGSWYILALFNWEDEAKDMVVRLEEFGFPTGGDYWGREFWSNRIFSITGAALRLEKIPAHGTVLLSLRHTLLGGPVYLGSDLHYSQGQEVSELVWKPAEARLLLELQRPGNASGIVDLNLPNPPQNAQLDGRPVSWVSLDDGCYRFPVEFNKQAKLNIFYRT